MRRPQNGRWWIEKVGFQNQHVTGSSKGTLNPDLRNQAEAFYLGKTNLKKQAEEDPEIKPNYGYLEFASPHAPLRNAVTDYGQDIFVFKRHVLERLTLTIGDSLENYCEIPGRPEKIEEISAIETGKRPWMTLFIPWKNRILAAPFIQYDRSKFVEKIGNTYGLEKEASLPFDV
jgi:hypothetical protein